MASRLKRRIRMQVRALADDAAPGAFVATVSTYELEYEIGWGWTEQIVSGCFTDSIAAHPVIPVYHQHDWDSGPIGSCKPEENGKELVVTGQLYLDVGGHLVARVYQAMVDGALEEWSIGFWAEEITWSDDNPQCDSITQGDLAEASICVRGANPETGTLELAGRAAWVDGAEADRRTEVNRLRAKYAGLPELSIRDASDPRKRDDPAGHEHEHTHGDTVHSHQHTHSAGNYEHDASDPEVTHSHSHPDDESEADPADDESSRALAARAMETSWGRELLALSKGAQ